MIRILAVRGLLPTQEDLDRLKADFTDYKAGLRLPGYFGRDADFYLHRSAKAAELRHLHLAESGTWPPHQDQYRRTSDHWLIYCPGFWNEDTYLLIAILKPDAHMQADRQTLDGLAAIAESFREKY